MDDDRPSSMLPSPETRMARHPYSGPLVVIKEPRHNRIYSKAGRFGWVERWGRKGPTFVATTGDGGGVP